MISKTNSSSKFDRLPRIELPSFNGEGSEWKPYWEKFTNALSKDVSLTDVDRLSFLTMTMKCKEGMEIINSHTRRSPDYEAAVRALKERYLQRNATRHLVYIGTPKKTIFMSLLQDSLQRTILPKERLPQMSPGLSISWDGSLLLQFW